MQTQYDENQVKDIKERTEKAIEALKELHLIPAAYIQKVNMGDDVFGDKLFGYLQDTLYTTTSEVTASEEVKTVASEVTSTDDLTA